MRQKKRNFFFSYILHCRGSVKGTSSVKITGQQDISATMADGFKFPSLSDFESVFRDPLGSRSTSPPAKLAPSQTTIASQKNPESVSPSRNSLSNFESSFWDPLGLYESASHSRNQSDDHFKTGGGI